LSGLEIFNNEKLWNEIHPLEMQEYRENLARSRFIFPCDFINDTIGKLIPPEIFIMFGLGGSYKLGLSQLVNLSFDTLRA